MPTPLFGYLMKLMPTPACGSKVLLAESGIVRAVT
jgi:hypothetical protein